MWDSSSQEQDSFTSNDLICAYMKGREEGVDSLKAGFKKLIMDNMKKAAKNSHEVVKKIRENKFDVITAYLNIHEWNELEVLFVVPEEHYLDSDFIKIYDFVKKYETKLNNENYSITFSFVEKSDTLDKDCILSDGFHHELKSLKNERRTC